jgi:alpha-glucosidase (family GH31 glycosyl hydrolase)
VKYDIPLDTMWADIDYMDDFKLFTISPSRYANLAKNVSYIKTQNMTFVPIMDAGVAVRKNDNFITYDKGIEMGVFVKTWDGSEPLTGGVWCGDSHFTDHMHPDSDTFWHYMFDHLRNDLGLDFDGVWLDLNEATNQRCNGYCKPEQRPVDSLRNKAYYVPGWRDLEDESLGVDGLHANGWREYDVHNLYSLMQVKATASYLTNRGLRPYVLSRSNFAGLGKYGYHWMGDNWSNVDYMKLSVDGVYSYSLFGLPFMGCDLCGFDGDAAADLCTKWH